MLDFITKYWIIILVAFIMLMMVLRIMTTNPKYKLKEIAKKPWLIFQVLARAAAHTIDILEDAQETMDKLEKEVDETKEKVEDVKEAIEELKDSTKDVV